MKFSTNEDLQMPIDALFEQISQFERFERAMIRKGAEITRTDDLAGPCVGMTWRARGNLRGRKRDFAVMLAGYEAPHLMNFTATSDGVFAEFDVELMALSRSHTRMRVGLDLRPKTLPARLILQSAKLARTTLTKRFKARVETFCRETEDRYGLG